MQPKKKQLRICDWGTADGHDQGRGNENRAKETRVYSRAQREACFQDGVYTELIPKVAPWQRTRLYPV
jgi:hypothetical protein